MVVECHVSERAVDSAEVVGVFGVSFALAVVVHALLGGVLGDGDARVAEAHGGAASEFFEGFCWEDVFSCYIHAARYGVRNTAAAMVPPASVVMVFCVGVWVSTPVVRAIFSSSQSVVFGVLAIGLLLPF